jgi:hypothetical protein
MLFRYAGDTIWYERDTTVRRSIYRGDTIVQATFVGGRVRSGWTMVVIGDSAVTLSTTDSLGSSHATRSAIPARMALADREMIAMEIRVNASRARVASLLSARPRATDVPIAPRDPVSYCVDASLSIRQHVDTVQYIRTVSGKAVDTTTYVFTSDTSIKRLSPSPREFGYAMANTVMGEMHMSLVRKNLDARAVPVTPALPGRSYSLGCAGR